MALLDLLTLLLLFCVVFGAKDVKERSFTIANDMFMKDGEPFRIIGGDVHYFRILPDYWEDRLLRAKSLGLNTIQTYVPWNIHEPHPGKFHFGGSADLKAFLTLADKLGLLVMLRAGPYICGEWDFGGFPAWLLAQQPSLALRTSDSSYLDLVDKWWDALLPLVAPLLYSKAGPIIMVQIENEFGSYGNDKTYLQHLAYTARVHLGEDIVLYTTDGATDQTLEWGTLATVYAAVDFSTGSNPKEKFSLQKKFNAPKKSPSLSAEFYTGWLTHWNESLAQTSAQETAASLDAILQLNASVVLYMAHGGTNFGFFSGANTGVNSFDYEPDITSYDYDAPIGEAGDIDSEKFKALRAVILKYVSSPVPDPPPIPTRIGYGFLILQQLTSIFNALNILSATPKHVVKSPVPMEAVGQAFGFILYRTLLPNTITSGRKITIAQVHDRAQVFISYATEYPTFVGTLERWNNTSILLKDDAKPGMQLDILVENMGRINYGPFISDSKGIISTVKLDDIELKNWTIYPIPLDNITLLGAHTLKERIKTGQTHLNLLRRWPPRNYYQNPSHSGGNSYGPVFYKGILDLKNSTVSDTFLSLKGWTKGVAFINGFNLGRFWPSIGPQCTLYVPAPLLQHGENELVILELETPTKDYSVEFVSKSDFTCGKGSFQNHNTWKKM